MKRNISFIPVIVLGIIATAVVLVFLSVLTHQSQKSSKSSPSSKYEKIEAICKEYGHTLGDFEFVVASVREGNLSDFEAEGNGNCLWKRKCGICNRAFYRKSCSSKTPFATPEMQIVARDEAERACEKMEIKLYRVLEEDMRRLESQLEKKQDKPITLATNYFPWGIPWTNNFWITNCYVEAFTNAICKITNFDNAIIVATNYSITISKSGWWEFWK